MCPWATDLEMRMNKALGGGEEGRREEERREEERKEEERREEGGGLPSPWSRRSAPRHMFFGWNCQYPFL